MRYVKRVWKTAVRTVRTGLLLLLGGMFCVPVLLIVSGTIMSRYELTQNLLPMMADSDGMIGWTFFPLYPTFEHFFRVLFCTPQFFTVFWNSVKIVGLILAGQLFLAVPAAWAFAVYSFRFRKLLFTLYVVLMLMPFQVTMLSSYLVLNGMGLMNTHAAVILPAVFSTFPVFLIYRSFLSLPKELLEAARMDGAGEWRIFVTLGLPLSSGGILSAVVLGFLEYWNMMEQPLAFLQDQQLWPLSLYLPEIGLSQAGYSFVASVLALVPAVFVFLAGQDYLEQGIIASGIKE